MENKTIGIIGHFGGNENILDGQTIKTKILYKELSIATNWKIVKVDTYYKSHNPIKLLKDTITCLNKAKDIIVLLSGNGMKFYFPLLSFFARFKKTRVFHDVIGGNLDRYVNNNHSFKRYLSSFVVNWVETKSMKEKLNKQGILNCEVLPNFKRLNVVELVERQYNEPFSFCIFSRVMKEKGIEIAIDAIELINAEIGRQICKLDIYGRIDDGYNEEFKLVMKNASDAIQYKGTIPYDKSVEAIKDYYALLFPTFWDGEGFPGTIVDAFSAGLPVIASDWNCNKEIVDNKINGILYPNDEIKSLKEAIEWLINHSEEMGKMKKNCIISANKYQPDDYIKIIIKQMGDE